MVNLSKDSIRVLLVDDSKTSYLHTRRLFEEFSDGQYELEWESDFESALTLLDEHIHDLYLIDYWLGRKNGLELMREAGRPALGAPVILLTGNESQAIDVEAMRSGAADYLVKGQVTAQLLERSIRYALNHWQTLTALRESEFKYRNFIETLPVMFYAVEPTPPFCPYYVSPAFSTLGYPLEEWQRNPGKWLEVLHPADRDRVIIETELAIKEGRETDFEYRIIAADGSVRWIHDRGLFMKRENGEIIHWQGVMLDITDTRTAVEALREKEEQFSILFENATDIVYIHDLNGNFVSFNQAAEKIFKYDFKEMFNLNMKDVIFEEDLPFAREKVLEKIAGVKQATYEIRAKAKDGTVIVLEINSCGIYKDDVLVAVQGIARDITERKQVEAALRESEAKFRTVAETASDAILTMDERGTILFANKGTEKIFGYKEGELLGKSLAELLPERYREAHRDGMQRYIVNNAERVFREAIELPGLHREGHEILLEFSLAEYKKAGERFFTIVIRDITERKQAEKALKESEAQFRELFENANDLIYTHDLKGNFTSLNRAGEKITGYSRDEIHTMNISEIVAPEFLDIARQMTLRKLQGEPATAYELEIISKDGRRVTLELSSRLIYRGDKPVGVQGIGRDISERKLAEEKLQYSALYDTLTDLPNRSHFMDYLKMAIDRASRDSEFCFGVLFLDLDRFKVINDGLGHLVGDKLLVNLAERLKACLRPGDVVARLGGDEFTILINNVKHETDTINVAERIQRKLSEPFRLDNYEVFTSASIGIIVSDDIPRKPEDFLRDADTAMYRAKEAGKSRYEIFDREMHIRNMNLLQVETDLRRALERGEFRVFYQPIVEFHTRRIIEFEALIRWEHPQLGFVTPNEFVPVAEETGLIIPIGKWVLEEACRQRSEWTEEYPLAPEFAVSVNLSAKQLMHPAFTGQVRQILEDTGSDPRFLKLEVTESMVMEHSDVALNVLSELHALGLSLSTDDFGTGYSSLSYLHRFSFERLKVDRSFVSKMDDDPKSEAIVRTILMLGQSLGIEVVAEGIETLSQLERLQNLGCNLGQGYLFSKPVSAEDAREFFASDLLLPGEVFEGALTIPETAAEQILELKKMQ